MKKILLVFAMLIAINLKVNAMDREEISYREIVTNMTIYVEGEMSLLSTVISHSVLKPNEKWTPRALVASEALTFGAFADYGHIYYYYEIAYLNGNTLIGFEKEMSYDSIKDKSNDPIDEVRFYYSYAAQINVEYQLENGEEVQESSQKLGNVTFTDSKLELANKPFAAESFDIDPTIEGYKVKEVIGSLQGVFTPGKQDIVIIYEPVSEAPSVVEPNEESPAPKEPVKPVEPFVPINPIVPISPTTPVDTIVPTEPVRPKDEVDAPKETLPAVNAVDKSSESDFKISVGSVKPSDTKDINASNETLPATGVQVPVLPYFLVFAGILIVMKRKSFSK